MIELSKQFFLYIIIEPTSSPRSSRSCSRSRKLLTETDSVLGASLGRFVRVAVLVVGLHVVGQVGVGEVLPAREAVREGAAARVRDAVDGHVAVVVVLGVGLLGVGVPGELGIVVEVCRERDRELGVLEK